MKRRISAIVAVMLVVFLVAVALWFNVPRSADVALDAVLWNRETGETELTAVHFSGKWTPDFVESKATFQGNVWVDALDMTQPETSVLSELRFNEWSEGELSASASYRSAENGTLLDQCAITIYSCSAQDGIWLQIQLGDEHYVLAAPFSAEEDAIAYFNALNINPF